MGILTAENIIRQRVIVQYDQPNMMRRTFCKSHLKINDNAKLLMSYIYLNHYKCLCNAFFTKTNNVLVLEDDNIILKDFDKVLEMLDAIPADFDYINFNSTPRTLGSTAK